MRVEGPALPANVDQWEHAMTDIDVLAAMSIASGVMLVAFVMGVLWASWRDK